MDNPKYNEHTTHQAIGRWKGFQLWKQTHPRAAESLENILAPRNPWTSNSIPAMLMNYGHWQLHYSQAALGLNALLSPTK